MTKNRVKISDIAEELGLSTATVSNVIHGKTNKVSEETIKRVQALLEERQYIPSMAGILLAQNSSKIIGVFVNDHEKYEGRTLSDAFIAAALNALSTEIEKQGQFMMVKKTKDPEEIIQFASMWNMDGLVVLGFCHQDYTYLRNHMRIPFVIYDGICEKPERIVNLQIDNFDGGRQMGQLFRKNGYQRIICISDNNIGVDKERIEGFREGFYQNAAEGKSRDKKTETWIRHLIIPMTKTERWQFYEKELPLFRSCSSVFAMSDYYAIDLMHFLQKHGITVPQDIALAGFDDIPLCEMVYPTLTTVKQDNALRAQIAIEKLKELRDNKEVEASITLPVTLIQRESTGEYAGEKNQSYDGGRKGLL